jgi:hypothetical protein
MIFSSIHLPANDIISFFIIAENTPSCISTTFCLYLRFFSVKIYMTYISIFIELNCILSTSCVIICNTKVFSNILVWTFSVLFTQ